MATPQDTIQLLTDVLQLRERARSFDESTRLLGSLPELDSMAVVSILTALEERFGIVVEDDEISADLFETVGTLHRYIQDKRGA